MNIPAAWMQSAHELWLSDEQMNAITMVLNSVNQHDDQKPLGLVQQLGYYLFLKKDYASAVSLYQSQLKHYPDEIELLLNLAVCCSRQGEYAKSVQYALRVLDKEPNHYAAADTLAKSYYSLGHLDKARHFGHLSLVAKDKLSENKAACELPDIGPGVFTEGKPKIVSFSLWGNNPRYLAGAVKNSLTIPDILPGWILRFYVDNTVPEDVLQCLEDCGSVIIKMDQNSSTEEKLTWRFHVADDTSVGYFLVRDTDSIVSVRETLAVHEWLKSERWFHVIRDWWTHTDLILAGMWGGVAGVLPSLQTGISNYVPTHVETPNFDQWFLRDCVWPHVKSSCLIHDRFFNTGNAQHLPDIFTSESHHIGQNAFYRGIQDPVLKLLSKQVPSLRL